MKEADAPNEEAHCVTLIGGLTSWTVCSIGMLVFNTVAVRAIALPCFLLATQMAFASTVLLVFGWSRLHIGSGWDVFRLFYIVVPWNLATLLSSLYALKHSAMSLVVTFKALSPLVGLVIERIFFAKPPQGTLLSFWPLPMILLGVIIYAQDLQKSTGDMLGIMFVSMNTLFTIVHKVLQRRVLSPDEAPVDISTTAVAMLIYQLSMIPLFFVALVVGELEQVPATLRELDGTTSFYVFGSCIVCVGIGYTTILAQSLITATSFLVLVNANKIVIIFIEVVFMPAKHPLTQLQVFGALTAITGTVLWGCRETNWSDDCRYWLEYWSGASRKDIEAPLDVAAHDVYSSYGAAQSAKY